MNHHEDVQERAYQEIVKNVGTDRLPGPQDQDSLPFVKAIIQEVHRFNPAVPLASHSNYQDEQYEGQNIPKKSWIVANIWYFSHTATLHWYTPIGNYSGLCCMMILHMQTQTYSIQIDSLLAMNTPFRLTLAAYYLVLEEGTLTSAVYIHHTTHLKSSHNPKEMSRCPLCRRHNLSYCSSSHRLVQDRSRA